MKQISDWKFINDFVRLQLFAYRPLNPLSNTFAYALNSLQFFTGCCYDALHASKCIKQPDGSFAADTWQPLLNEKLLFALSFRLIATSLKYSPAC